MNFKDYQIITRETAVYPDSQTGNVLAILYTALGVADEAGEVAGKVKKWLRDEDHEAGMNDERREAISGEISDVLWYLARLADELNLDLQVIAEYNVTKLRDRKERGVIQGNGDNR